MSMSVNGAVRRSTPASRNTHESPRLIVTTGASAGSSPSWWMPSRAPGAYRLTIAASGAKAVASGLRGPYATPTAARARATMSSRQRLHRRAVGVVGGAGVLVRQPVPAETNRLHAHQMTGRHPRMAEPGRRRRPLPKRTYQLALGVEVEPCRHVYDTGQHDVPLRRPVRIVDRQRQLSSGCGDRGWQHGRHPATSTSAGPSQSGLAIGTDHVSRTFAGSSS